MVVPAQPLLGIALERPCVFFTNAPVGADSSRPPPIYRPLGNSWSILLKLIIGPGGITEVFS
jgi:hypothetical protein